MLEEWVATFYRLNKLVQVGMCQFYMKFDGTVSGESYRRGGKRRAHSLKKWKLKF
jgi:hypothetical protein